MTVATRSVQIGFQNAADEERYLRGLQTCFPNWGDARQFAWCYRRSVAGRSADALQVIDAGVAVAGVGIAYRRLAQDGSGSLAAILMGAWTLPRFRGAGAFTTLIGAARELASDRGATLLVSFVTATNASLRRMQAAGSMPTPSIYARSGSARGVRDGALRAVTADATIAPILPRATNGVRFLYTLDEWRGQFVLRPSDVHIVVRDGRWTAIVERVPGFDRVLALDASANDWPSAVDALTADAVASGRELFLFTTDSSEIAALRPRGFTLIDGFVTAMPTRPAEPVISRDSSAPVTESTFPLPSRWLLQNGDRM